MVDDSLTTSVTRDHRGDVIRTKSPGGLLTDTNYDGVGRQTVSYVDYGSDIGAGTATWGGPGWTAVGGDWDGSGHTEVASVDPNGNWWLITTQESSAHFLSQVIVDSWEESWAFCGCVRTVRIRNAIHKALSFYLVNENRSSILSP